MAKSWIEDLPRRIEAARQLGLSGIRHGLSDSPEWSSWRAMKKRVSYPKHVAYSRYGGRGVWICARWKVFENFLTDMGPRPSLEYTLERIDNNGNYEPGNCRWALRREQSANMRTNRLLTIDGETKTRPAWAQVSGVPAKLIKERMAAGWDVKRAVFEPKLLAGSVAASARARQNALAGSAEERRARARRAANLGNAKRRLLREKEAKETSRETRREDGRASDRTND